MRSPITALLWEQWRLTRIEMGFRIIVMLIGGGALTVLDKPVAALFFSGYVMSLMLLSIVRMNGGRFIDGYHPGFPLHLLYTRPVLTSEIVGIAMGYMAVAGAAIYIVWALLMRAVFEYPFPVFSVACWMALFQLVQGVGYWTTRSKFVQWFVSLAGYVGCNTIALRRGFEYLPEESALTPFDPALWPEIFAYTLTEYALMIAIAVACFAITIAGVSRQRRGDARAAKPQETTPTQSQGWLSHLIELPCPTSSPIKAQIWFDLRTSGLQILGYALIISLAIPVMFKLSDPFESVRGFTFMLASFSLIAIVWMSGNAFGIRSKQGHSYAGSFESIHTFSTARLAMLKVLVRTVCVSLSLLLVAASYWLSLSLSGNWGDEMQELIGMRNTATDLFLDLPLTQQAALLLFLVGAAALVVAFRAAMSAVKARYPRQLFFLALSLVIYGLVYVLRGLALPDSNAFTVLDSIFTTLSWLGIAAILVGTVILYQQALAEKILTLNSTASTVLLAAVFATAWIMVLKLNGVQLDDLPATTAARYLSLAVMPLVAGALAPWALSRVRHT